MRRPLAVFALAALLGTAGPLPAADEVPHLEFVSELRARYPDLALEYLDKLAKSNPAPDVAAVIPLELAKVHLELANAEVNGNRRLDLYTKARGEFQQFIDKNPTSLLVADARVDLARVTALQAKAQLSRALMQEELPAREKDALAARDTFQKANAQLQAAADQIARDVDKYPEPKTEQEKKAKLRLQEAHLQAQLDIGLNLIDQAQTYLSKDDAVRLARLKVIGQAQPILARVDKDASANSLIGWQARAWVAYCDNENGDTPRAMKRLDEVIGRTEPAAAAGKRLAHFLKMRILIDDPDKKPAEADITQVHKDADAWVSDYRNFLGTAEGCGVRFYMAYVLVHQAAETKEKAARTQPLNRARALCTELMRSENDYTERARGLSIEIISLEGGFSKEIGKLATFEECLLRAEFEAEQLHKAEGKSGANAEDLEKERKARFGNAIEALTRGLDLAGKSAVGVPPAQLGKARSMLCGYYLFSNKYKEAIAAGEAAARAVPPTAQSARAAMYVLEAYNNSLNESLRDGTATLADLEKDGFITRMSELALMMEQRWPAEQAGDVARHMRGLLLIKQKKQAEAIDVLSRVTPGYTALIFVKNALAMTAFQAAEDRDVQAKAEPDKAKKEQYSKEQAEFEKQALEALTTMPPLPPGADPVTTSIYLKSKEELARAYYRRKEYGQIDKLVDPLIDGLQKGQFKLGGKRETDQAESTLALLKLFGKYGAAEAEFAAGRPAKVKEITDPIVDAILKGEYAGALKQNPDLRWGLMGLALRINIQEGNTGRALKIYEAAKQFAKADAGEKGGTKVILIQIAMMVKDQAREARKKKDNDALGKYGDFLKALKDGEKDPKPEFLRVMAEAYAALGTPAAHDTAVELARQVPEPKEDDAKDMNKTSNYHFCRILIVRQLREGGKEKEAAAELDELLKTAWGKEHPEVTKETIHLMSPGKAYTAWSKLVTQLGQRLQQGGAREKEQYFECYYYMTESMFRYAKALKDDKKKEDYTRRAAGLITKLEGAWPDLGGDESKARFTELLDRESALKEQYDKLKADK